MENTQLKMLMDYTLFHIGAYITLSTLLVSVCHSACKIGSDAYSMIVFVFMARQSA
jgi:hypothetical protein